MKETTDFLAKWTTHHIIKYTGARLVDDFLTDWPASYSSPVTRAQHRSDPEIHWHDLHPQHQPAKG